MNVVFHRRFDKMASKLPVATKQKMAERIALFARNPLDSSLRVHALHATYRGCYSIDIMGGCRAIYILIDDETALFTHIGAHSQLYR